MRQSGWRVILLPTRRFLAPHAGWMLALLTGSILAGRAGADEPPVASDPVFSALKTDGSSLKGRIRQFGPKGEVSLVPAGAPEQTIPLDRLVKLEREGTSPTLTPEAMVVLFPEGDRLYHAVAAGANETTLDVQPYSLTNLAVPLESLLGIVFSLPQDSDGVDAMVRRVREEPRTSEIVWLANDDQLRGGFVALSEQSLQIRANQKTETLDRTRVAALGFEPSQIAYPKPEGGFLDVTLTDGSRLGVSGATLEQGNLVAKTRFGTTLKVPMRSVVRFHARTASVVYLTEREPARVRYIPYVGSTRPFVRNATVEGRPFRLGSQEFDRGIGTTSRTLLAYRIEKGDRRFQATVGVDDRAGPLGNVVFRVLVDAKEVFASPPVSAGDPARPVDVDLASGSVLILITEFGERGDVRDLADWVEARVVR